MPCVVFANGEHTGDVPALCTLLDAAMRLGAPLEHACGGRATCGTCRVRVDRGLGACSPMTPAERPLLGSDPRERLGCQARFVADVTVTPLGPLPKSERGALRPPTPRIPGFLEATRQEEESTRTEPDRKPRSDENLQST